MTGEEKMPDPVSRELEGLRNRVAELEAMLGESSASGNEGLRAFLDSARIIPWTADAQTFQFTYVGPQAAAVFGYPVGEWYGKDFWLQKLHPQDREEATQTCMAATRRLEDHQFEYRMIAADGRAVWVRDVVAVVAEDGRAKELRGVMIDVTPRKEAELALADSRQAVQRLMGNLPGIAFRCRDDGSMTMLYLSEGCQAVTGYQPHELMGNARVSFGSLVHAEDRDKLQQAMKDGEREGRAHEVEYRIRSASGETRWIWQKGTATSQHDGGTVFEGFMADISGRQHMDEERDAIREMAIRLAEATDIGSVGKILARASRRVLQHDAFIATYYDDRREMSVGIYSEDTFTGDKGPREVEAVNLPMNTLTGLPSHRGVATLINRTTSNEPGAPLVAMGDRTRKSMSLMYAPMLWQGRAIGVISAQSYTRNRYTKADLAVLESMAAQCGGTIRRILAEEERRVMQAQMLQTQKLESLGVLAGGIAHDFNNLLMSVLGYADLTLTELPPGSPLRDYIAEIEAGARRGADLCKQMLAYSGKGRFVVGKVDLRKIIEEMTHLLQISISKRAVIKYHFAANLPSVEADASQVRQVTMNLVLNASEALGEKSGIISIGTGAMECDRAYLTETYLDDNLKEGVYVFLEVADNGCGMDETTRARIFDPFFTTKFLGRGLGLAAVLGIVRGHRGAIKVYSEPNRGTTVKVLFPAAVDTPQPKAPGSGQKEWRGAGTILVVDDEASVRTITKLQLERSGFKVLTANDGADALNVFREKGDDIILVILDLTMPNVDGQECFRELRRLRKNIRCVLSSGFSEQDVTQRFAGKGLAGFIQKPFKREELLSKVREALEHTPPPGDGEEK